MRRYYVFVGGPCHGDVRAREAGDPVSLTPPTPGPGERVVTYEHAWTLRFEGEPVIRLMTVATDFAPLRFLRRVRAKWWFERQREFA